MTQSNSNTTGKRTLGVAEDQLGPKSSLDFYEDVSSPSTSDEFLSDTNLGLGNYDSKEYWMQVDAFKGHIFAKAAFKDRLLDLAMYETQWKLGEEIVANADSWDAAAESWEIPEEKRQSRRMAIHAMGKKRWDNLGFHSMETNRWQELQPEERREYTAQKQIDKLEELSGTDREWLTPLGRMISVRHEASRSLGARLMDNIFGRVDEVHHEEVSEADVDSGGFFG